MTNAWVGSTNYLPDGALSQVGGAQSIAPHILALPDHKVLIDWVSTDTSHVEPAFHNAAVGDLRTGTFVPSAEHVLATSILPVTFGASGNSSAQIDPISGGIFICSWAEDGDGGCSMVMTKASYDLATRFSKVIDITQIQSPGVNWAQPYIRNMAASVGGNYYRFVLDPTDGVTVHGITLDSSFNDVSTATFTLADAYQQIGGVWGGVMVSGDYVVFTRSATIQVMARVSAGVVVDMWTRSLASTRITGVWPGVPGDFVVSDGSSSGQRMTMHPDRSETLVGSVIPMTPGGNINVPDQIIKGEYWSFLTGPSGGS